MLCGRGLSECVCCVVRDGVMMHWDGIFAFNGGQKEDGLLR